MGWVQLHHIVFLTTVGTVCRGLCQTQQLSGNQVCWWRPRDAQEEDTDVRELVVVAVEVDAEAGDGDDEDDAELGEEDDSS